MEVLLRKNPSLVRTHAIGQCIGEDSCGSIFREAKTEITGWSIPSVARWGYGGFAQCPVCQREAVPMYPLDSDKARQLILEVAKAVKEFDDRNNKVSL